MIARHFACHLMDAAAGAMGIARGDALFALAALLWGTATNHPGL